LKSGSLNLLEPSGPVQAYNGTALLLSTEQVAEWAKNRSGRYGEVIKLLTLLEFEPRTVQPVA